jgi:hypothetical protein
LPTELPDHVDLKGGDGDHGDRAGDTAPSCAHFGCVPFRPDHACQCNPECKDHGSCCPDFGERCTASLV